MQFTTGQLFVGFVLIELVMSACIIGWRWRRDRRRRRELELAAAEMGLTFTPNDSGLLDRMAGLPLLTQAVRRRCRNVLADTSDKIDVRIMECQFTIESREGSFPVTQTALYLESADLDLPWFAWRAKEAAKRLQIPPEASEIKDLEGFESAGPRLFARKVVAVDELFRTELIGRFESFAGLCVEADGNRLLVYRFRRRAKPSEVRQLLTEGLELFGILRAYSDHESALC